MHGVTVEEVERLIGSLEFRAIIGQDGDRAELNLSRDMADRQTRLSCRPALDLSLAPQFADGLNR